MGPTCPCDMASSCEAGLGFDRVRLPSYDLRSSPPCCAVVEVALSDAAMCLQPRSSGTTWVAMRCDGTRKETVPAMPCVWEVAEVRRAARGRYWERTAASKMVAVGVAGRESDSEVAACTRGRGKDMRWEVSQAGMPCYHNFEFTVTSYARSNNTYNISIKFCFLSRA